MLWLPRPAFPGITYACCLNVNASDSWPRRSLVTLTGTPALTAIVACVWRRSCSRICRRPAFLHQSLERLAEALRVDRLMLIFAPAEFWSLLEWD